MSVTEDSYCSEGAARSYTASPHKDELLDPYAFHTHVLPSYEETKLFKLSAKVLASLDPILETLDVRVKDESTRFGLPAFKILGASYAVFLALCQKHNLDASKATLRDLTNHEIKTVLYAATDGNHGRAVARMGALLGLETRISVPASVERYSLDRIASEAGCKVEQMQGMDYDQTVVHCQEQAQADPEGLMIQDTAWKGYETIPMWIVNGYKTLFAEIDTQLAPRRPTHVFVPVGVGSLAHASVLHYRRADLPIQCRPRIVAVEPRAVACLLTSLQRGRPTSVATSHTIMPGLNCGTVSSTAWKDLQGGIDAAIQVDDADVERVVHSLLASKDGNLPDIGPCGAAGLVGLVRCLSSPELRARLDIDEGSCIVLISSEGTETFVRQSGVLT